MCNNSKYQFYLKLYAIYCKYKCQSNIVYTIYNLCILTEIIKYNHLISIVLISYTVYDYTIKPIKCYINYTVY